MIIICIVIGVVFVFILGMIIKAYYKDIVDLNDRVLQLEKRLEDYRKGNKEDITKITDFINNFAIDMNDYRIRIEKIERKRNIQKNS